MMTETITVVAKSGLTVTLPAAEHAAIMLANGVRGREFLLTQAGRILGHQRVLAAILAQSLTAEKRRQIDALARSHAIQHAVTCELLDMGYENCVMRSMRGGMMPPSWSRLVDQARGRIDESQVQVTYVDRDAAMRDLGLYSDHDRQWSEPIARSRDWTITAPEGWGQPTAA